MALFLIAEANSYWWIFSSYTLPLAWFVCIWLWSQITALHVGSKAYSDRTRAWSGHTSCTPPLAHSGLGMPCHSNCGHLFMGLCWPPQINM